MSEITNRELYESLEKLRRELEADDKEIERKMSKLESKIDDTYTKLIEFHPVKRIVYGMVTVILTGFLGMVMALVGWSAK